MSAPSSWSRILTDRASQRERLRAVFIHDPSELPILAAKYDVARRMESAGMESAGMESGRLELDRGEAVAENPRLLSAA